MAGMKGALVGVLGALVVLVVGANFIPTVANASDVAADSADTETSVDGLIRLLPLLFVVLLLGAAIGFIVESYRGG